MPPIDWPLMGKTALQAFFSLWFVLIGLKLVGRRVFGEMGPQDLILIILVAEAMSMGLVPQEAGFMGSLVSVTTMLVTIWLVESIGPVRQWMDGRPLILKHHGHPPEQHLLDKNHISDDDLVHLARRHGYPTADVFDVIVMESDGKLSGVLKPEFSGAGAQAQTEESARAH